MPAWIAYAAATDLTGVFAIVLPYKPNSTSMTKKRRVGLPAYELNTADPTYWRWVPIPNSEALTDDTVTGSSHQVATRNGAAPSDPTIEQFDPLAGPFTLYITD